MPPRKYITFSNLQKIFWTAAGYTKRDLVQYYEVVSPQLVPYVHNRPVAIKRYPDGIDHEGFFQHDLGDQLPPWMERLSLKAKSTGERVHYALCQDKLSLLYLINLGTVELHPWHSRAKNLGRPDYIIFDIDPQTSQIRDAAHVALAIHEVLQAVGAKNFCKTSGKRGLHVYVPLHGKYRYERAAEFALAVAKVTVNRVPEIATLEWRRAERRGRVYLDVLQNAKGKTAVAAYSVRATPQATVSTPLRWEEVTDDLDPQRFTIKTMRQRMAQVGDLWEGVLSKGIDLDRCLDNLRKKTGYGEE